MGKIFVPHVLKMIEVDTEKKIFKVNGEDFGKDCTGFTIVCQSYQDFDIRVEIDTTVKFVKIRNGKCVADQERQTSDTWFSEAGE